MALLGSIAAATAKNSQAEWFSSDITVSAGDGSTIIQVHLSITTAVALAYTIDSGTTWIDFNEGAALVANSAYVFSIPISNDVTFNIRKSSSGNVTVNACEVHSF